MTIQHVETASSTAAPADTAEPVAAVAVPVPAAEPRLDRDPDPSTRPSLAQVAAGVAVLIGLALLLLRTDDAGQISGAVLAAVGLVGTVVVEWIKVARRRALER